MTTPAGASTGSAGPVGGAASAMPQSDQAAIYAAEQAQPQVLSGDASHDTYLAAPSSQPS
jgi:hypothetical protein